MADKYHKKIQSQVDRERYLGYSVGSLRKIFTKYQDKDYWKNPFSVLVMTSKEAKMLAAAVVWFHGIEATITKESFPVRHKEGLVYMTHTGYRVTSPGYAGS